MHKIFECCAAFPSLESFDLVVKDFKGISYPPVSEIVAEFYNLCEILSARNYKFKIHFTWQIFLKMDKLFKQMKGEFDGFELSSDNMILPIYTKSVSLTSIKTAILKFKFY
uniref:Uncharacterized protein n=1 Tax=Panagrolaimus sp. PS1159 TaxID=55785 RepID=A0AC35G7B2_9BILA